MKGRKKIFPNQYINDLPLYGVWCVMKQRCHNPRDKRYVYYGKRGVRVCPSWANSFILFYKWAIRNGYKKGLTIDRINNNGNYSPCNCKFSTMKEQSQNKRKKGTAISRAAF